MVKKIVSPRQTAPDVVNAAVGFSLTVMSAACVNVSEQVPLAAISETLYVPGAVYVCDALVDVDVPPSPKFQLYVVPPVVVLVNETGSGPQPVVVDVVS